VQDNDQQAARVIHCPNCGASNPAGAGYCAACGSRLPDVNVADEETLIDVSSSQPRVLEEEPADPFGPGRVQGGFTTVRIEQGRVFVSQGNRRTCLLIAIVVVLVFCCACWLLWSIPGRLF
jgi:hypothetical protein